MANPLVDHLRKGVAGEGAFARVAALAKADGRRQMIARLKRKPLARLFVGTTLAFACGVGLGVGVATVIAPEAATIRGMIAELPSAGAPSRGARETADDPVVAVRLRDEAGKPAGTGNGRSKPPIAFFTPVAPKEDAPAPSVADGASVASGTAAAGPETADRTAADQTRADQTPADQILADQTGADQTATAGTVADRAGETAPSGTADAPERAAEEAPPAQAEPPATDTESKPTHIQVQLGPVAEAGAGPSAEPADTAPDRRESAATVLASLDPAAPVGAVAPETDVPPVAAASTRGPATSDTAEPASSPAEERAELNLPTLSPSIAPPLPMSELKVALGPSGLDGLLGPMPSGTAERRDETGRNDTAGTAGSAEDLADVKLPPRPARKNLQLAALPMPRADAWIRNALVIPDKPRDVEIAVIIDDMGIDQKRSRAIIGLPGPLTLSFIPYGYHLHALTRAARRAGHEVMLHVPMEPLGSDADPGPNALRTTLSVEENRQRLLWALSRVDGIVGLNNHMGSRFTTWRAGMEMVMQEVRDRGLLFVDSFTNNESVGYMLAKADHLPSAARDVFVDHVISRIAISRSLAKLERIARRRGFAVGIAHPHDLSREGLRKWMVEARARGVDFVPISHIVREHMKRTRGG
jgi:hypothetical protein